MTDTPIPETMADLMQMAIDDGRKLDRETYYPHWSYWCRIVDGQCHLCAAGAMLISTFNYAPDEEDGAFQAGVIPVKWQDMLTVVDRLRNEEWALAAHTFYGERMKAHLVNAFHDRMQASIYGPKPRHALDALPLVSDGVFVGWGAFDAWMEYVETVMLPILRQTEQEVLRMRIAT